MSDIDPQAARSERSLDRISTGAGPRMRDLAPDITRQRLLIEGYYSIEANREAVRDYLYGVAHHLQLRTYGEPSIHSPAGTGKTANQGFDAFIPLIDSGISLYVWTEKQFFSTLLYTCKAFSEAEAIDFTKQYFGAGEIEYSSF